MFQPGRRTFEVLPGSFCAVEYVQEYGPELFGANTVDHPTSQFLIVAGASPPQ
jgi:hypothetical protein